MIVTEGEVGNLNSTDWQELATLYDTHAPIRVVRSKEPLTDVSTDPFAPAPGRGDELDVFAGDWQVPAQLRGTFAPLSGDHLGDGDPSDTPGAGSSAIRPSEDDITARAIRIFPTPPAITYALDPVPAAVTRSKPPPLRMGRRGRGLLERPNSEGHDTTSTGHAALHSE